MKNSDEVIKQAVKEAQHTFAEYVHRAERDVEDTVEKLNTTLDGNDLNEAILESDRNEKQAVKKAS